MESNNFRILHSLLFKNNIPFAAYRLPGEATIKTIINAEKQPDTITLPDISNDTTGFIFAPFDQDGACPAFLFHADKTAVSGNISRNLIEEISHIRYPSVSDMSHENIIIRKDDHIKIIEKTIENITSGTFRKAILSRVEQINDISGVSVIDFFLHAAGAYPKAFTYLVNIPGHGIWTGASPELLVKMDNEIIETNALAGTLPFDKENPENVAWQKKERDEQKIVADYVEDTLKQLHIIDYQKTGPYTSNAGNVVHLKTRYVIKKRLFNGNAGDLLCSFHPTPSVCGFPKETARQYIRKTEPHDREYYTGFLGPMNIQGSTSIYVNLRCMKIASGSAWLFAGGGITEDSNPENEWTETEMKLHTLLSILKKIRT